MRRPRASWRDTGGSAARFCGGDWCKEVILALEALLAVLVAVGLATALSKGLRCAVSCSLAPVPATPVAAGDGPLRRGLDHPLKSFI